MIQQATLTLLSGGKFHCAPVWNKQADGLDQCYKMYFPERGQQTYLVIDGAAHELRPEHFYFVSGYRIQAQRCSGSLDTYWVHFVPEALYLNYLLAQAPPFFSWPAAEFSLWQSVFPQVERLFEHPTWESNRLAEDSPTAPNYLIQSMLLFFIGNLLQRTNLDHLRQADPVFNRLKPALDFMDSQYLSSPSLKQIAARVHLSPVYFHRKFSETFRLTPYEYMLRKRMNMARQMLGCTELSIKEISARLGYINQLYFSRVFSQYYGMNPTRMRNLKH